jgi:hypothetical protein
MTRGENIPTGEYGLNIIQIWFAPDKRLPRSPVYARVLAPPNGLQVTAKLIHSFRGRSGGHSTMRSPRRNAHDQIPHHQRRTLQHVKKVTIFTPVGARGTGFTWLPISRFGAGLRSWRALRAHALIPFDKHCSSHRE